MIALELGLQPAQGSLKAFVHGADREMGQLRDVLQAQVGAEAQREHLAHLGLEPVERAKELVAVGELGHRVVRVRPLARVTGAVQRSLLGTGAALMVGDEINRNCVNPRLLTALAAIEAPSRANDPLERVTNDLLGHRGIPSAICHKGVEPLRMLGEESLDVVIAHATR